MQESIACKKVDGFGVANFEFIFDDHDQFEDSKCFKDENSML